MDIILRSTKEKKILFKYILRIVKKVKNKIKEIKEKEEVEIVP